VQIPGDALPDLGEHVVGEPDQVPVVDRDPSRAATLWMPEAYGSMTTSSIQARSSD
jgi:hypothetical protein